MVPCATLSGLRVHSNDSDILEAILKIESWCLIVEPFQTSNSRYVVYQSNAKTISDLEIKPSRREYSILTLYNIL
jgi:hypothetical protein